MKLLLSTLKMFRSQFLYSAVFVISILNIFSYGTFLVLTLYQEADKKPFKLFDL